MRTNVAFKIVMTGSLLVAGACGGGQHPASGLGKGSEVPPPPPPHADATDNTKPGKPEVKREISKDERKDYEAAGAQFTATDKANGWNESQCRSSAERFQAVVKEHPALVEAQYMVGLSYHRCNLMDDAEKAYQQAIRIKPNHGPSLSNLGEIYYRAKKLDGARQYWDSAIKANGKLIAARINVASMELDQMRKVGEKDTKWKTLEEDARFNLSNVLGVDSDNVKAYTLYGLVYMEGWQKNKNRLDLAKLLLDEAKKRDEKYGALQNAYGLWYMHKGALSEALQHFMAAVEADPKFVEARMNVGITTVNFRKYDTAKEQFSKAIELDPKNYDAYIGLGIALRGLKDFDGAEAQYNAAMKVDSRRGEAFYNLAVLYKDFKANKQTDLKASQDTYRKAKGYFQDFQGKQAEQSDKDEAKEQVTLIDKTVKQIDDFIKAQANQPPTPPTPAAPAAGAAADGTPAGTPPAGAAPARAAGASPAPAAPAGKPGKK